MLHTSALVLASVLGMAEPHAAPAPALPANIRPLSAFAQQTLADGVRRSPTFAALVQSIASRGTGQAIVYIDAEVDAALPTAETMLMSSAGSTRFVRIVLNPALTFDRRVELLGHELQHAMEIIEDPTVRDGESFRRRFRDIGREAVGSTARLKAFETEAARGVSVAIRRELAAPPVPHAEAAETQRFGCPIRILESPRP
jgi:hypothetical protein